MTNFPPLKAASTRPRFRFWPDSLKYRLLLAMILGSMVVTGISGIFVFRSFENYVKQELDDSLRDSLRFYRTVPYVAEDGTVKSRMPEARNEWDKLRPPDDREYIQYAKDSEKMYKRATDARAFKLPTLGLDSVEPVLGDCVLPDGEIGRGIGCSMMLDYTKTDGTPAQLKLNLVVAKGRYRMHAALKKLSRLILQSAIVGIGGLLATALLIIRRGVRSVAALEQQIIEIPVAEKAGRFHLPGAPSEVKTVVNRLNELMNRVDEALEHERTFTSNAAHELRTPLAGMRTQIEVALSRTRSASEYEDTLFNLKEMQNKLQQLVDNLLLLAKLESGQKDFASEATTLRDLFRAAWKPFFDPAADKSLSFSMPIAKEQATYVFPTVLLSIVLRNLLQNAVDYTPEGGKITLSGKVEGLLGSIIVRNTNPGLTNEDAEQVFQPFYRADKSGDPNQHNAGIGLALSKRIMGVLEGDIILSITDDNFVQFECNFPVTNA